MPTNLLGLLKEDINKAATKTKKKSIPKVVKDLSWAKWVGDDVAKTKCLCCGINEIKMNSFHCGHVVAEANGGSTTVENLRPICAACNTSMGTENLDVFRAKCGFTKQISVPSAGLSLTNDNLVASASLGSATLSMSLPVNQVVQAITNTFAPNVEPKAQLRSEQPRAYYGETGVRANPLLGRGGVISRVEMLVAQGKLTQCPGQEERYEMGGLFPTSPCKSDSSRFRRHCTLCGYHYHYVSGYMDGPCPCR
jgi:hypothetical protein